MNERIIHLMRVFLFWAESRGIRTDAKAVSFLCVTQSRQHSAKGKVQTQTKHARHYAKTPCARAIIVNNEHIFAFLNLLASLQCEKTKRKNVYFKNDPEKTGQLRTTMAYERMRTGSLYNANGGFDQAQQAAKFP